jgi:ATP-binding protein involved in chromosome partitioning
VQFGVPFLGSIELDPDIRKGGDNGKPVALDGETSPHAKSLYEFARNVVTRVEEVKKTSSPGDVIHIQ